MHPTCASQASSWKHIFDDEPVAHGAAQPQPTTSGNNDDLNKDEDLIDSDKHDIHFECRTDDGRRLTNLLSSICLTAKQRDASTLAWCEISDTRMIFTVGVAKSLQAVAYVKREGMFHTWWLAEEHTGEQPAERLEFGINLATLLECLRIFGGASSGERLDAKAQLHISYRASTACLNLSLVEGHCVSDCEIHTLDIEPPHRVHLTLAEGERIPARILIASDALKSGIDELEWGGDASRDKTVHLGVTAARAGCQGCLSLTVSSTDVGCEMSYPTEALVSFDVTRDLAFEYRFLHMSMALRALKDSHQTMLQLDTTGTLEIKMRFSSAAPKAAELFSHFFLFPLLDEDNIDFEEPPADEGF